MLRCNWLGKSLNQSLSYIVKPPELRSLLPWSSRTVSAVPLSLCRLLRKHCNAPAKYETKISFFLGGIKWLGIFGPIDWDVDDLWEVAVRTSFGRDDRLLVELIYWLFLAMFHSNLPFFAFIQSHMRHDILVWVTNILKVSLSYKKCHSV